MTRSSIGFRARASHPARPLARFETRTTELEKHTVYRVDRVDAAN